jgi:trans-2,3-dihydro-3-hydroxyanthranilate isomerase
MPVTARLQLEYDVVDVFTSHAFAGNPLAVVHGADNLDDAALAAIAVEFNLSETTFPMRPSEPAADYRARIFTPGGEIPFAGHPTIGTAWVMRARGRLAAGTVVQECGAGLVDVGLPADLSGLVELAAAPRDQPVEVDGEEIAVAVGLTAADLAGPALASGCGLTFLHVPVAPGAVARARPPERGRLALSSVAGVSDPVGGVDVYAVGAAAEDGTQVHARVFCPEVAVVEDPATGSSAAGLGLALHARGLLGAENRFVVTQGVEMGRPSRLFGRVETEGAVVTRCRVAGGVVQVASGRIAVPGA